MFRPGEITARLRARPLHPFRVVESEGPGYEIRHPESVIGPRSAADPTVESAPASGKAV
mgnify:CR=1 FL=1